VACFCTDPNATVAEILATVADRFALETTFRDCKEIVGAGQQQVRFVWANIGAFHICLWTFTMTEAWAWARAGKELVDRKESRWDDPIPSACSVIQQRHGWPPYHTCGFLTGVAS
jgi:hypothetical protein